MVLPEGPKITGIHFGRVTVCLNAKPLLQNEFQWWTQLSEKISFAKAKRLKKQKQIISN